MPLPVMLTAWRALGVTGPIPALHTIWEDHMTHEIDLRAMEAATENIRDTYSLAREIKRDMRSAKRSRKNLQDDERLAVYIYEYCQRNGHLAYYWGGEPIYSFPRWIEEDSRGYYLRMAGGYGTDQLHDWDLTTPTVRTLLARMVGRCERALN